MLEQERLAPEEAVMVGDRRHDIIGAKANGLGSAGVLWGYGSREERRRRPLACLIENETFSLVLPSVLFQ